MKDFAWFLEVPGHAAAGQETHSGAVRAASRNAA